MADEVLIVGGWVGVENCEGSENRNETLGIVEWVFLALMSRFGLITAGKKIDSCEDLLGGG